MDQESDRQEDAGQGEIKEKSPTISVKIKWDEILTAISVAWQKVKQALLQLGTGRNLRYLVYRLSEASTWRSLARLLTIAGIAYEPEQWERITAVGLGVSELIGTFLPDRFEWSWRGRRYPGSYGERDYTYSEGQWEEPHKTFPGDQT